VTEPTSTTSERFEERRVTYTVEIDGRVVVVENVPARVSVETGEQYFSPETVERLHSIVRGERKPVRTIQTPVYEFAA
jgi:YgiT-type zinc finger domain-containing protein